MLQSTPEPTQPRHDRQPRRHQPYRRHVGTDGPTGLFVQLMANPDFRQMFADHVYKDLTTVLSPTNAAAMYQTLANTISTAVLDESARWGNLGELDGTWNRNGHARHLDHPAQLGTRHVVPRPDGHHVHRSSRRP